MTKSELHDLLEKMYDLNNTLSDERISEDQYFHYKSLLENCTPEDEKDTIRNIVYELDINKPVVARAIAYPFSFNSDVNSWLATKIEDGQYYCAACRTYHLYDQDDMELRLTIDHEPALSKRFNLGEWQLSREERRASYNDIRRLQVMCQSQNSSKGGENYDVNKIQNVFVREL